jgi:ribosomal protein L22
MSDQEIAEKALSNAITFALYDYDNATKCAYLNGKNEFYNTYENKWISLKSVDNYFHSPRAMSDVNELIKLRNANAELKKEVDKHRAGFVACMTGEQFTIHNLKQQAKGAVDVTNSAMKKLVVPKLSTTKHEYFKAGIRALAYGIDKEAKALKEGKQ